MRARVLRRLNLRNSSQDSGRRRISTNTWLSKVGDSMNDRFCISERVPTIDAWHEAGINARYLEWRQVVPETERCEPHGSSLLLRDICEEPVRRCDEGWTADEVPSNQRATVRATAWKRFLLRFAVHSTQPIHEGYYCWCTQGKIHCGGGRHQEAGDQHLLGMDGGAAEAPLSFE